jgi:hypothetical protein
MEDLWRPAIALAVMLVAGAWVLAAWSSRKRKALAALEPVAAELGLKFHGDTFRGRIRGHAVRGDAVGEIPGRESRRRSFLAPFSFGRREVRVRIELTTPDAPPPEGPKALATVRRELKGTRASGGAGASAAEPGLQVALHGTEIAFIMRGDAIDPHLARRVVEMAIEAAKA